MQTVVMSAPRGFRRILRLAPFFLFLAMLGADATDVSVCTMRKLVFSPNPGGLQVGFWANYNNSWQILSDFGPRSFERVGFHKWAMIEKAPGVYDWGSGRGIFYSDKNAHLAGADVITNVNMFFTRVLNARGMDAIPPFYAQDITQPETRRAAREFLAAFVTRLLAEVGAVKLILDYEVFWFGLPKTPEIRETYRDWFVDAAGVCRDTARSLGKEHLLQIGCCANPDPLNAEKLLGAAAGPGHVPQQWLLDVVASGDFSTLDSYPQTKADPSSPAAFFDEAKFWLDYYAGEKPVFVTENGFSSAGGHGFVKPGYHARGTEIEQAEFFGRVFAAFAQRNRTELAFLKKIRGYGIWMYRDMPNPGNLLEQHFGITRMDGSRKPAWQTVKAGIELVENNPELAPVALVAVEPVVPAQIASGGLVLAYESGASYQALELTVRMPAGIGAVELVAELDEPACLIVRDRQGGWTGGFSRHKAGLGMAGNPVVRLPVGAGREARDRVLVLYFTQERFPCKVLLRSLTVTPLAAVEKDSASRCEDAFPRRFLLPLFYRERDVDVFRCGTSLRRWRRNIIPFHNHAYVPHEKCPALFHHPAFVLAADRCLPVVHQRRRAGAGRRHHHGARLAAGDRKLSGRRDGRNRAP
ncbi:MAG: hypothetical protein LBC18_10615 [Opitutaceae bacterium]|jgi:hypothetical protein|nr:hypothetical protein [Opitutaceae bacterium]